MEFDPADVRPSLINWTITGIMAVTFIVFMKYLTSKYPIPGLTQFFAAA